jgi:hypothetical protein
MPKLALDTGVRPTGGLNFEQAWARAIRNCQWPQSGVDRWGWKALLRDPEHMAYWQAAYERRDSRADTMRGVHVALEEDDADPVLKRPPEAAL